MTELSSNAKRLIAYRQRLAKAGFKRISAYVSRDLVVHLQLQKVQGECIGRTLERLLLGRVVDRPEYYSGATVGERR
ncbi:MAG: hypothetical protein H5U29_07940, partial [Pusillimonas sp.]|nr:hypothetical protein [Pusillimonas sp.]